MVENKEEILFNEYNYSFLSNSYPYEMLIDNKLYYHVEGYYQSSKYRKLNECYAEYIRQFWDPSVCKAVAHDEKMLGKISKEIVANWESEYKVEIMKKALMVKFAKGTEMANKLLSTGTAKLIELAYDDEYWSSGKSGLGLNMLGKLLMEIRESIKNF